MPDRPALADHGDAVEQFFHLIQTQVQDGIRRSAHTLQYQRRARAADLVLRDGHVGQADAEEVAPGDIDIQRTADRLALAFQLDQERTQADRGQVLGDELALHVHRVRSAIDGERGGLGNVAPGDAIIVSRDVGCHGAAILMAREGLTLESTLQSDCATLWPVVEQLIAANIPLHAMRDATRGGLSAVLNEWAVAANVGITVNEASIPVCDEVKGLCELYGFEPMDLANEGTFILAVPNDIALGALEIMQRFGHCEQAAIIGTVSDELPGKVILRTPWNTKRYLDLPQGELLPRIC